MTVWLALVALVFTQSVAAEQQPRLDSDSVTDAEEDVFPLPEIVVQGRQIEAPPSLILRQVTEVDIEARNAHTVGEAMIFVPGVNVQIGGTSGDARAWIRGYRDRDVLVLFDGIPIASGFEGTVDLKEISIQRVSAINVVKSAPSVIYGTNGVGGVIDILPNTAMDGLFLDGRAELGTNQRRYFQASGGAGGETLGFALSAQYRTANEYSLSDDYPGETIQVRGDRVNSDFDQSSLFFQMDARDTALGHTSMFVSLADAEKGLAVETGIDDPDYERLTMSKRRTLGLSNQFSGLPLSLKLWYNGYESELTAYTDDSFSEIDNMEFNEDYSYGGKVFSTLETSSSNTLILSAGAQTEVFKGVGELEEGNKAELTTWTLAAEDQFWISQRLSLVAGGIFVYFDQTRLNRSTSEFNPQLALAWQATDRLSLHASAAQRTRFPKLRELYRRRYGNPDLDPQTAENYEVGLVYRHANGWKSDLAVFHSDIDGLIERADRRATYTNFDPVTIDGIEAAAQGWWAERFFMRLSYTYVDAAEDLSDGGSRQLRSRPKHTAIAEFRYHFHQHVTLSFSGIYVSDLYDLDPDDVYTELPSFVVGTLKAAWAISEGYEAYLAVSNLGDTDYLHRLGDPRAGRAVMLGLNFEY